MVSIELNYIPNDSLGSTQVLHLINSVKHVWRNQINIIFSQKCKKRNKGCEIFKTPIAHTTVFFCLFVFLFFQKVMDLGEKGLLDDS